LGLNGQFIYRISLFRFELCERKKVFRSSHLHLGSFDCPNTLAKRQKIVASIRQIDRTSGVLKTNSQKLHRRRSGVVADATSKDLRVYSGRFRAVGF